MYHFHFGPLTVRDWEDNTSTPLIAYTVETQDDPGALTATTSNGLPKVLLDMIELANPVHIFAKNSSKQRIS